MFLLSPKCKKNRPIFGRFWFFSYWSFEISLFTWLFAARTEKGSRKNENHNNNDNNNDGGGGLSEHF